MKKYGIIYLIINKINNKIYIGQTTNKRGFDGRYNRSGVPIEKVYKIHLYNKKYGFDAFEIDKEFDIAYSKEELDKLEKNYIAFYKTTNPKYGYNNREGGNNSKASKQTLIKMSKAFRGKNNPMYGKCGSQCPTAKKVICLETKKIFESSVQGARFYNIKSSSQISRCCSGKRKSAGKLNDKRLHWAYYDEYIKNYTYYNNVEFNQDIRMKKVICLETMEVYNSLDDVGKKLNLNRENIGQCVRGNNKTAYGFHWMYYDEYIKNNNNKNKSI